MNGQRPCRFIVCEDEVMRCDTNSKLKTVPLADHGCIVDRIDPVAEIEQIGVMTDPAVQDIVIETAMQRVVPGLPTQHIGKAIAAYEIVQLISRSIRDSRKAGVQ